MIETELLIKNQTENMFRKSLLLCLFALLATSLSAQISRLDVEVRGDWQYDSMSGEPSRMNHSGFEGKFANFRMDGSLIENLTYSFRYRINKVQLSPFAATDWATLNYKVNKWEFSAGKQVVAIGGYEYDRAPIDIYFASEYWHQIACYQFGVSAAYKFGGKRDSRLLAQICQSPYDFEAQGLYAYNLMYMSNTSLSSVNLLEYAPNKYLGYIALGEKESFGAVTIEWDVMTRFDFENKGCSFSSMLDVNWAMNEKLNLFTHASYDINDSVIDPTVLLGTEIWRLGGGVEYFPFGKRNVRIHAVAAYTFGEAVTGAALQNGHLMFQTGLTWRVNLLGKN